MGSKSNTYIEKLKSEIKILKKCQQDRGLESCLKCKDIIGCSTRKSYVNIVYKSMNKGESGGFEF